MLCFVESICAVPGNVNCYGGDQNDGAFRQQFFRALVEPVTKKCCWPRFLL